MTDTSSCLQLRSDKRIEILRPDKVEDLDPTDRLHRLPVLYYRNTEKFNPMAYLTVNFNPTEINSGWKMGKAMTSEQTSQDEKKHRKTYSKPIKKQ